MAAGFDPAANAVSARAAIAQAADAGARLVVLPEATMARLDADVVDLAQPLDGPFASAIRDEAARRGVVVVAGMFTPASGRARNTLLVTGPGVEAAYDKIHLFDAFGSAESDRIEPGCDLVTLDIGDTVLGLATCYDLRFADQFTALGRLGAEVICVPASWAAGRGKASQWDVLVRARAMDSQAWLIAADQPFVRPRGSTPLGIGRSTLADPLGRVTARLGRRAGLLVQTIDLDRVSEVRTLVPILGTV